MTHDPPSRDRNLLLAALGDDDFARIAGHLKRVRLDHDQVLIEPDQPIARVHFFEDGIASVVAIGEGGEMTEIAIVGRDGFAGVAAMLGDDTSPYRTFMQVGDATALQLDLGILRDAMERNPSLRTMILRYVRGHFVQTAQGLVSHAHHRMEARLARWLLMCHDRLDGDDVPLTHAFMSMMIAAQRTGVMLALHGIEGAGLIRARRGTVTILDRDLLEEPAGDAYGRSEAEYRRLIRPFGKSGIVSARSRLLDRRPSV